MLVDYDKLYGRLVLAIAATTDALEREPDSTRVDLAIVEALIDQINLVLEEVKIEEA